MKFVFGVLVAMATLLMPETAANAAREAARVWYMSVAPSLFPFMVLMPLLTGEQAVRIYNRLLGGLMRPLMGLSGKTAPAVVIGMIAGAPAGALAASRLPGDLPSGQRTRVALCACGLSPAFLISGLGASILGSVADGQLLLKTQILTQLALLSGSRLVRFSDVPVAKLETETTRGGLASPMTGILNVCGTMVSFSVLAALLREILHSEVVGTVVLCLFDLPSGIRALTAWPMLREVRLISIAALNGFGGICIAAQNLAVLRPLGIQPAKYIAVRFIAAVLSGVLMYVQLYYPNLPAPNACLFAIFLAIPALMNLFLNKRNLSMHSAFQGRKALKNTIYSGLLVLFVLYVV